MRIPASMPYVPALLTPWQPWPSDVPYLRLDTSRRRAGGPLALYLEGCTDPEERVATVLDQFDLTEPCEQQAWVPAPHPYVRFRFQLDPVLPPSETVVWASEPEEKPS
jgi:hypothetical protein